MTYTNDHTRNIHIFLVENEIKHCINQWALLEHELFTYYTPENAPDELRGFLEDRISFYGQLIRKRAKLLNIEPDYNYGFSERVFSDEYMKMMTEKAQETEDTENS